MMDQEETPKKSPILEELMREDISTLGAAELQKRIDILEQEIKRTKDAITERDSSRKAAEAVFGKL